MLLIRHPVLFAFTCCVASYSTDAFALVGLDWHQANGVARSSSALQVSFPIDDGFRQNVFRIPKEEIHAIARFGSDEKEKVVNAFGVWCLAVTAISGMFWVAAMHSVHFVSQLYPKWDPHRAIYDKTGKVWSKLYLKMTNSFPTQSGNVDALKEGHGACLYVANHASWLDIPVLCTVLDPVFKFIAKGELRDVPFIGQQLTGGDHILLDREDKRSQLRTFKESIKWLKEGVPIMAFPEGKRSIDGRLSEFKKGIFSMAVKCNVPIVPLTICNTHAVMPSYTLFPVQNGAGKLHVHVHDAIDTAGKTEDELAKLVRDAFLSELPIDQLPADHVPQVKNLSLIEELQSQFSVQIPGTAFLNHQHDMASGIVVAKDDESLPKYRTFYHNKACTDVGQDHHVHIQDVLHNGNATNEHMPNVKTCGGNSVPYFAFYANEQSMHKPAKQDDTVKTA